MDSKKRAILRSRAAGEDAIFQVGKDNLSDNLIAAISDALKARELVKISVLKSADVELDSAAQNIAKLTKSEVVATIGNKIILYKEKPVEVVSKISSEQTSSSKNGKKKYNV